jgi:hypothetical protein
MWSSLSENFCTGATGVSAQFGIDKRRFFGAAAYILPIVFAQFLKATLVLKLSNYSLFYCSTRVLDPDPVGSRTSLLDLALYLTFSTSHKIQTHSLKLI